MEVFFLAERLKIFSCALIFLGGISLAQDSQTKAPPIPPTIGRDPFGGEAVNERLEVPVQSPAEIDRQGQLELVRRVVEDIEADDTIAASAEEAEIIRKAEELRRSERNKLIRSIDGIGIYLAEIAREKVKRRDRLVGVYLQEMSEIDDVAEKDVIDLVELANQVMDGKPSRLDLFEVSLLNNVIRLLKAHPVVVGKTFLLRAIQEQPEFYIKLHAAEVLAAMGDQDTRAVIESVARQSAPSLDPMGKDRVDKLKAALQNGNELLKDDKSEPNWMTGGFVLLVTLCAFFVFFKILDQGRAKRENR